MRLTTALTRSSIGVAIVACTTFGAIPPARADIACNSDGECWHTSQRYTEYPSSLGIQFYSDDWRKEHEQDMHYRWMPDQNPDRGYYFGGRWHPFR